MVIALVSTMVKRKPFPRNGRNLPLGQWFNNNERLRGVRRCEHASEFLLADGPERMCRVRSTHWELSFLHGHTTFASSLVYRLDMWFVKVWSGWECASDFLHRCSRSGRGVGLPGEISRKKRALLFFYFSTDCYEGTIKGKKRGKSARKGA
jgi:hypothetical protein